ncbi:MAG: ribosome-associated translation inhibitor RaiA [Balneolales bacterium]
MNTTFTARKFDASDHLQDYANQAVRKLEKYYDSILVCDVVLMPHADPDQPQKAELNLQVPENFLTAIETGTTYEHAINKAVDSMKRQVLKYKNKRKPWTT